MSTTPSPALQDLCKGLYLDNIELLQYMKVFRSELTLGISDKFGDTSLKCLITYIEAPPRGDETGSYLALHFAGTIIRVAHVTIKDTGYDLRAKQYQIPKELLTASGWKLFDFLAQCVHEFATRRKINKQGLPLGFAFGFPCNQVNIKSAVLTGWVKEFKCPGVVGKDVVVMLENAISKIKDLDVNVCALINDTTGTLLSCAWIKPNCKIGVVHDIGTNICYVEKNTNIKKYPANLLDGNMIINTECGNMGANGNLDFLRTGWDKELDKITKYPGTNLFEKMISEKYIGEIVRRVLVTAIQRNIIFQGKMTQQISTIDAFESKFITEIVQDSTNAVEVLTTMGYTTPRLQDCVDLEFVCQRTLLRSAKLLAASISAVLEHMEYESVCIGFDGTFYRTNTQLQEIVQSKIRELTNPGIEFQCHVVDDRGGLGAALAAAIVTWARRTSREPADTPEEPSMNLPDFASDSKSHGLENQSERGSKVSGTDEDIRDPSALLQKSPYSSLSDSESSFDKNQGRISKVKNFETIQRLQRRESKNFLRKSNESGSLSGSSIEITRTRNRTSTASDPSSLGQSFKGSEDFGNQSRKSQIDLAKEAKKSDRKVNKPQDTNVRKSPTASTRSSVNVSRSRIRDMVGSSEKDVRERNSQIEKSVRDSGTQSVSRITKSGSSIVKETGSAGENKVHKFELKESEIDSQLDTRQTKPLVHNAKERRQDVMGKRGNYKHQTGSPQSSGVFSKSKIYDESSRTTLSQEDKIKNLKAILENSMESGVTNGGGLSISGSVDEHKNIRKPSSNVQLRKRQAKNLREIPKPNPENIKSDQQNRKESDGSISVHKRRKSQVSREENYGEKVERDTTSKASQHSRENIVPVKALSKNDISMPGTKRSSTSPRPTTDRTQQSKTVVRKQNKIEPQAAAKTSVIERKGEDVKDTENQNSTREIKQSENQRKVSNVSRPNRKNN